MPELVVDPEAESLWSDTDDHIQMSAVRCPLGEQGGAHQTHGSESADQDTTAADSSDVRRGLALVDQVSDLASDGDSAILHVGATRALVDHIPSESSDIIFVGTEDEGSSSEARLELGMGDDANKDRGTSSFLLHLPWSRCTFVGCEEDPEMQMGGPRMGPWSPYLIPDLYSFNQRMSFQRRGTGLTLLFDEVEETKPSSRISQFSDSGRSVARSVVWPSTGSSEEPWIMRSRKRATDVGSALYSLAWLSPFVGGLLCAFVVVTLMSVVFGLSVAFYLGFGFMDSDLRLDSLGDPGRMADFFDLKCTYLMGRFAPLREDIEAYNVAHGWTEISFSARYDKRSVAALYMPSPANHSPLVVLAHSAASHWLDNTVQTAAYFLRTMNISVLVPDLNGRARDKSGIFARQRALGVLMHGIEPSWDLLGAWDAAVNDPNDTLGGSRPGRQVGLYGFEYGARAALLAFGGEPGVLGVMLDGNVQDVRKLLLNYITSIVGGFLASVSIQPAWGWTEWMAQKKLNPDVSRSLGVRSTTGFVGIVHSVDDQVVPIEQRDSLLRALAGHQPGFDTTWQWYPFFLGGSECTSSREVHLDQPSDYRGFLCNFWSTVFDGALSCA